VTLVQQLGAVVLGLAIGLGAGLVGLWLGYRAAMRRRRR
jgi:hypothetical protein